MKPSITEIIKDYFDTLYPGQTVRVRFDELPEYIRVKINKTLRISKPIKEITCIPDVGFSLGYEEPEKKKVTNMDEVLYHLSYLLDDDMSAVNRTLATLFIHVLNNHKSSVEEIIEGMKTKDNTNDEEHIVNMSIIIAEMHKKINQWKSML
jgi:hypothetical protein